MSYNRKIFYMSFYEKNEKKGNKGFVKVIEKKDIWEAQLRLLGVPSTFDGEGVLEVSEGERRLEAEVLFLEGGKTCKQYEWEKKGDLSNVTFLLRLSEDCVLYSGNWGTDEGKAAATEVEKEPVVMQKNWWTEQEILWTEPEEMMLPGAEEVQVQEEAAQGGEFVVVKEEVAVQNKGVEKSVGEKVENRKWKQICKAYPHIKPFDDFREYIKLELRDMVLVSEKRYSLVENSFLLHGYYNYGHIILWRKEKAPVKYYVGVPGNFYDKEKQVAVLYGFESFEGAVEPAKEGDFGYYMTEVIL